MLGRASGGPAPDDHAGNVTIENAERTEPGSFNQLGWKLLGAGGKMLHVGQVLYDNDPRYRGRTVESIGSRNAVSFANADHAKSSFSGIGSTATGNNIGPDIRSCHRRP
jgi:hypothetical protein